MRLQVRLLQELDSMGFIRERHFHYHMTLPLLSQTTAVFFYYVCAIYLNLLHAHLITQFGVCIRVFSVYVRSIRSHLSLLSTFGAFHSSCVAIGHFQTFRSKYIHDSIYRNSSKHKLALCFHSHFLSHPHILTLNILNFSRWCRWLLIPCSHYHYHFFLLDSVNISHIYEPFAWLLWLYFAHHILFTAHFNEPLACMRYAYHSLA